MIDGGAFLLVLRMVVSLAIVLGLVVLFARWLERRGVGGAVSRRSSRARGAHKAPALPRLLPRRPAPLVTAEVLARTPLSRSASLQVVRVGGQILALGVTDHGVRVLTDLGPADLEVEDEVPEPPAADAGPAGHARAQGRAADAAADVFENMLRREGRHRDASHDEPRR